MAPLTPLLSTARARAWLESAKRMNGRLRHRLIGPLAIVWLVITVASVVIGAVSWNRLSHTIDVSSEAIQFREFMNQLFWSLQDAETSQRDYLLTGKESFSDSFRNIDKTFPNAFDRLAEFAMHDRLRQKDLFELRAAIELKLIELRQSMAHARETGFNRPAAVVNSRPATAPMDRIREIVQHRHNDPLDILSANGEAMRRDIKLVRWTAFLAGLFGIGTGLFALYFYRLDYRQERAQRELLEAKLNAEEAVVVKSAFLATMSHEIRTPMNAILGFSELLEPEGLTPKQSQYVRAIRDSGASLLQLINDILDLSKIEAGKLELHPEPTDMRDSCEFLRTVFAEQAAKKSLQLRFELSPDLPHALLLDRVRLRQVLVNLLGNAVKFTDEGWVRLAVSWQEPKNSSNGTLLIDVEDTGVGIPAEKQKQLFHSFVQSDSRRSAEKEGSGLGLAIVKRLTEMMNGTFTLESRVGKGTIFHLRLTDVPVSVRLPVGDHAEPGGSVDFNDFAAATLLVVDDNETNRDLMAGMFEKTHHRLHFACNGQEALDRLRDFKVDIVLLDIRMPVMDGRTALAEIRKQPRLELLPVVAVTASSQAAEEPELRRQFTGYIRKPFSRHTLYHELASLLQPRSPRPRSSQPVVPVLSPSLERPSEWRSVAVELRRLLNSEWPLLRDSMAINETRMFGQKLRSLGDAAHCPPLTGYAATLITLAEGYVVRQLERHLAEFPSVVASIEALSAQGSDQFAASI